MKQFINEVMKRMDSKKVIIQNEYVFQQEFYHHAKNLIEENGSLYKNYEIYPENPLDIKINNAKKRSVKPRPDFIISNGKDLYILELKCKTKKATFIKGPITFIFGGNRSYKHGIKQINNDLKRIALVKKFNNKIVGGSVLLLTNVDGYKNAKYRGKVINSKQVMNINYNSGDYIYYLIA